jgi:serine/threonine protein kinase
VVRIGLDVAAGLEAGLREGLIHRDIKPANVLLDPSGAARIIDLGLAHRSDGGVGRPSAQSIIGTRGYMAPEQVRNPAAVDFRADIYSLGVTLSEAATGQRPPGPRVASGRLGDLLRSMLAADPVHRPQSYAALIASLRRARDG